MVHALGALEQCEASQIGSFDASLEKSPTLEPQEPLPPFEADQDAVRRAMPSWLGVRFRSITDKQRERFGVERGATMIEQVYPNEPAGLAGIITGDILLGPPGGHFTEPNQLRGWTMSSPRGEPIDLDIQRDGKTIKTTVSLAPYPAKMPSLPAPPKAGDVAPLLGSLRMVRPGSEPGIDLAHERHMLIFWATWCVPCKNSLPELLAWSDQTGVPVIAVSDEDEDTIKIFLDSWKKPFPDIVASDELRASHLDYGVSGTPTFVLVDEQGRIEWRQVGYAAKSGLSIPGWTWTGK
jgi:thiol-disulfide isomerase/thioredoxin